MKAVIALLVLVLCAVVVVGVQQRQASESARREDAERTLQQCWERAAANGGIGVALCKSIADSLDK